MLYLAQDHTTVSRGAPSGICVLTPRLGWFQGGPGCSFVASPADPLAARLGQRRFGHCLASCCLGLISIHILVYVCVYMQFECVYVYVIYDLYVAYIYAYVFYVCICNLLKINYVYSYTYIFINIHI